MDDYTLPINKINYTAISVLEQIGLNKPSQQQINIIESLILLIMRPHLRKTNIIESLVGNNNTAKHILQQYFERQKI